MEHKKGAVNWTVGKLVNIILLIVVLVLVAWGATVGGLNPLIDSVGAQFDEVKILFGFKSDLYSGCYETEILDLGGGKEFLEILNWDKKRASFNVCRDGVCNISIGGVGDYRLVNGKIDRLEGGSWRSADSVLLDKVVAEKENWERYNASVGFLETLNGKEVYNSAFTKRFVLFGDGSGWTDENVTAVWQNGEWVVQMNKEDAKFFDKDEDAIDAFVDLVWYKRAKKDDGLWRKVGSSLSSFTGNDDKVFWSDDSVVKVDEIVRVDREKIAIESGLKEGKLCNAICSGFDEESSYSPAKVDSFSECRGTEKMGGTCCCHGDKIGFEVIDSAGLNNMQEIGSLVGNNEWIGSSYDELDSEAEVNNLKNEFAKIKTRLTEDAKKASEVHIENLKKARDGKIVVVDGKNFVTSFEDTDYFPVVVFTASDGEVFGLKFTAFGKVESNLLERGDLRYFPAYLVERDGAKWKKVGDEEIYRLQKSDFNGIYFGNLVGKFLKGKCR
ncbi:hypothetical protein HN903_04690 [archaeon]|jgi:hypothetical protein|nr:hypothetical protein [archaeon]MBT7129026.1 hypothetical protein [archaeon]